MIEMNTRGGIGLSHCEKNSSLHGCLFGAESKFGEGTVFFTIRKKNKKEKKILYFIS
jgi:light-regulated signal transduction histidine kinase (bacteriophytochrome)